MRPATRTTRGFRFATPTPLPPELASESVARLAWMGLVYAASFAVFYLLNMWAGRPPDGLLGFYTAITGLAMAAGIGTWFVARSGRLQASVKLDIGLLFQVFGGLLISLSETAAPFPADTLIRYNSMTSIWVVFFALVVPASFGKTVLATLATASMGPFGLVLNILWHGNPAPPTVQWLLFYASAFLMAVWTVLLARYIYRLGQQAHRARVLGSYELLDLIGRGGMGEVWKARHRLLIRDSAVKLIRPEALCCTSGEEVLAARRRFEREARATAALHSPHTVAVHDYGVAEDGAFYYVMELLEGMDLDQFVTQHGPQSAARTVHIVRQICESLAEAHAMGLTHRDIKPRNVFLCRLGMSYDFVKVLDFGLVKVKRDGETQVTRDGGTTGTPAFMAPELAMGDQEVDSRTDLYAVGCVAYWLLTGELVFKAGSALAMALEHVQTAPVAPSTRTEIEVPAELDAVVLACLAKKKGERPESARELIRMLDAVPVRETWGNEDAEHWWTTHIPTRLEPVSYESSAGTM